MGKVEREVAKATALMEGLESEIGKKRGVSRRVKALQADIAGAQHEAQQLEAQQAHLRRQQAALQARGAGGRLRVAGCCGCRRLPCCRLPCTTPSAACHPPSAPLWPRLLHRPRQERIARLDAQARAKADAAESSIEARRRDKEAIEAENAAAAARLQENEALVRRLGGGAVAAGVLHGSWR